MHLDIDKVSYRGEQHNGPRKLQQYTGQEGAERGSGYVCV